jgi:hypothetical protein
MAYNFTNQLSKFASDWGSFLTGSSDIRDITLFGNKPNWDWSFEKNRPNFGEDHDTFKLPDVVKWKRENVGEETALDWASSGVGHLGSKAEIGLPLLGHNIGSSDIRFPVGLVTEGRKMLQYPAKYVQHWRAQTSGDDPSISPFYTGPGPSSSASVSASVDGSSPPGVDAPGGGVESSQALGSSIAERKRLDAIRRMLAGRYGRAETQLTSGTGGFSGSQGRTLGGYS